MSYLWFQNEKDSYRKLNQQYAIDKNHYTTYIDIMKFNFFGKKSKCAKCGKKFKDELELADHNRTAHTA
jgi:hypothetical protein